MEPNIDPCKPSPDRGLEYYASGLSAILRVVVGSGASSTHAYVKDIREALEALVYMAWNNPEVIPMIASANVPSEIYSEKMRNCYIELLTGLLEKFREVGNNLAPGLRIRLMNMVIRSISENARSGTKTPVGEIILDFLGISKSNSSTGSGGETSESK